MLYEVITEVGPLDVPQKTGSQAMPLARPGNQSGDIGDDEGLVAPVV